MVEKGKYCRSVELARWVLSEYGDGGLPVNVADICRRMGIRVLKDDKAKNWEGVCTVIRSIPYIVIKAGLPSERERYVLAHELGHLVQGHVGAWGTIEDRPDIPRPVQEREAIAFGMEFIMPKAVFSCGEVAEIQRLCGVSRSLAIYRVESWGRGRFLEE